MINSDKRRLLPLLFLLSLSSLSLRAQNNLFVYMGAGIGQSIGKTTETTGLYPELLKDQNGVALSVNTGITAVKNRFLINSEFQYGFQNWIFDSYAIVNNLSLSLGYQALKSRRLSLTPYLGAGYFLDREFDIISGGEIYRTYNDSILYSTKTRYHTEAASRFNLNAGLIFLWHASKLSNLQFTFRYTRGLEPFLFMDLEAEHVHLGEGSSKAQYDGSAILFSLNYGISLSGLGQKLFNKKKAVIPENSTYSHSTLRMAESGM